MSWGDEFSLRLLGHLAGILPNPCPKVLHGLAIVGLTLQIRSGLEHSRLKNHTCSRLLYLDVVLSELSTLSRNTAMQLHSILGLPRSRQPSKCLGLLSISLMQSKLLLSPQMVPRC